MNHIISQLPKGSATVAAQLVTQLGLGDVLSLIFMRGMERIEHTLRGLSRAPWMDLASRPYTDKIIREQAHRVVAEMDAEKKK